MLLCGDSYVNSRHDHEDKREQRKCDKGRRPFLPAPPSDPEGPCSSDIPSPSALIALFSRMNGSFGILEQSMSELKRLLVLFVAFVAFLLAAYMQGSGEWRGPHSLRKSIHPKGGTIGLQDAHPQSEVAHELSG